MNAWEITVERLLHEAGYDDEQVAAAFAALRTHEGAVRVEVVGTTYHEGMAAFVFVCEDEKLDEIDDVLGRGRRKAIIIPAASTETRGSET